MGGTEERCSTKKGMNATEELTELTVFSLKKKKKEEGTSPSYTERQEQIETDNEDIGME